MQTWRIGSPLTRSTALLLLACYLPACTSWRTQQAAPQDVIAAQHPQAIRVTRTDGSQVEITSPRIEADTLIGHRAGVAPRDSAEARVAIPLSEVAQIEVRQNDAGKTIALAAGVGLAVLLIAAAASNCCGPNFGSGDSLKSSPLLYSWDGRNWRLDSGTFAGAITEGAARSDVDNLQYATAQGRQVRLKVTNELQETDYLDALSLLAVDHDPEVGVAPDGAGVLHTVGPLAPPVRAIDFRGRDALTAVGAADGRSWESVVTGRDTAAAEDIRDGVELVFLRRPGLDHARLVVDGQNTAWVPAMLTAFVRMHGGATQAWYDSLDARPQQLRELTAMMAREGFLTVSVWTGDRWIRQGFIVAPGPELAKRQVQVLDLSSVQGDSVRVRLESAPSFWLLDLVALDSSVERPVSPRVVQPERAVDAGGRDVLPLIAAADRIYYTLETGDAAELRFSIPEVPVGLARSYLVQSTGWYRIRAPAAGEPEVATIDRLLTEPGAASRYSVGRLNGLLRALAAVP